MALRVDTLKRAGILLLQLLMTVADPWYVFLVSFANLGGAHAPRVLAMVPHHRELV